MLTVLGITDDSFGSPYVLLKAKVASEPGIFNEKLELARRRLEAAWLNRSKELHPLFADTDIIGALLVAGQIFDSHGSANRRARRTISVP